MRKTATTYFLPGLILLMTVALAGIIVVQYFWIRNAISVKEALFDQAVNEALGNTIDQLKKDREMQFVSNKIMVNGNGDGSSTSVSVGKRDSRSVVWSGSGSGNYLYQKSNGNSEFKFDHLKDSNLRYKTIIKLDSLRGALDENRVFVLSEIQDSMEFIVRQKITEVQRKSAEVDEVIEDMVIELKSYDLLEDQVPDTALIRKRLEEAFSDAGIKLDFDFSVTEENHQGDLVPAGVNIQQDPVLREAYSIRLFPESLFGRDDLLMVEFSEKDLHILKSMGWLMGGSGLFTFIIMITFFLTIRIIVQQKKISAIKSDFINNMTHEFKTPIATISLALDSINNPGVVGNPEKIRYFTGIIGEENKRMNANVENVLQMSLIDKKDFDFRFQETNVESVISDVSKKFDLQLKNAKGSIQTEFKAEDPILSTDPDHLGNILSNLIDNAIKYSAGKPDITIATKNAGKFVEIAVKDRGIGMSREEQSKIFDKFYRVPRGDVHNIKGFGLGLSYVKAVVLAFGGSIDVSSQPSKGSVFRIRLPQDK